MDQLFVSKVPDLAKWGTLQTSKCNHHRLYICRTFEITIKKVSPHYNNIIHQMALSIASARLDNHYLDLWEKAVMRQKRLNKQDREIIARATARGICLSGCDWQKGIPDCNDDHFKGYIVEVLLFCLRIYLN